MIPQSTLEGIKNYVEKGVPPGGFLYAVLTNNLKETMRNADFQNRDAIFAIVSYVYNNVPSTCWGSPEAVNNWLGAYARARAAHEQEKEQQP